MEVTGFDPFLSVDAAWGLSRAVNKAVSLDTLIADSDYISIHVPLNDKAKSSSLKIAPLDDELI